jgi:transposase
MQKNTIKISSIQKKEIANELGTSLTTVQLSLDYYNNSDLAKQIRQRAKQLLIAEADKIKE